MNKIRIPGIVLLTTGFLSGQINLSQSLTACYALNGNGAEPINNFTATLSAVTTTVDRLNNPASALAFNGTPSSYIELPGDPLLKPTNAFSFSAWVKTSLMMDQYILMTKNPVSFNFETYCLHLGNFNGHLRIRGKKGDGTGNSTIITGTNSLSTNTWYHFVLTVDNSNLKVYTNGMLDASATTTFPFIYQAGKNVILGGSNEPNFDLPFTGTMDNLRFYNRVLNAGEVSALYSLDPSCLSDQPPTASFSVSASSICAGGTLTLTDLSSNNPTSWNWQVAGIGNSVLSHPTFTFFSPGIYTASLVASNAAGSSVNTATQSIVVLANPTISAVSTKTMYCPSETALISASGAATYTWNTGQTTSSISHPAIANSQVIFTVTGSDQNGCRGTTSITIRVADFCVGLNEAAPELPVSVSPNPASDVIRISSGDGSIVHVRLYDLTGRSVSEVFSGHDILLNIAQYPSGLYYLDISSDKGSRAFKVIRE